MPKSFLHLSIDTDLLTLAKNSNINLSAEFEDFIKFRMGQETKEVNNVNPDMEIAKLKQEIARMESIKVIKVSEEQKQKEHIMVLDLIIDNEIKYTKPEEIAEKRFTGLQYLFKQKFNEKLPEGQAKELITKRLKERALIA